jgi:hypothetical protein
VFDALIEVLETATEEFEYDEVVDMVVTGAELLATDGENNAMRSSAALCSGVRKHRRSRVAELGRSRAHQGKNRHKHGGLHLDLGLVLDGIRNDWVGNVSFQW